ncbi:MAG: GMP synthase [Gammaproteobacteria bacterium]|nr:GMP synthase [Gammaproteobacteria bacterium]
MKIGILQCDEVMPVFRSEFPDYPEMFERILLDVNPSLTMTVYRVIDGVHPEDIDTCDAYIFTGSRYSVYEDTPWIGAAKVLVQRLYTRGKKMAGICFGHQLIAEALGGKVERSVNGWGIGVHTWTIRRNLGLKTNNDVQLSLLVSHQDQVVQLPEHAELIASSGFCPIAAFQVGNTALCFQGHPEFTPAFSRALMEHRRERIGDANVDAGIASLKQPHMSEPVARWILEFFSVPRNETPGQHPLG